MLETTANGFSTKFVKSPRFIGCRSLRQMV
jgi:hypothetical protein